MAESEDFYLVSTKGATGETLEQPSRAGRTWLRAFETADPAYGKRRLDYFTGDDDAGEPVGNIEFSNDFNSDFH